MKKLILIYEQIKALLFTYTKIYLKMHVKKKLLS